MGGAGTAFYPNDISFVTNVLGHFSFEIQQSLTKSLIDKAGQ